jgi:hypothetical protein
MYLFLYFGIVLGLGISATIQDYYRQAQVCNGTSDCFAYRYFHFTFVLLCDVAMSYCWYSTE